MLDRRRCQRVLYVCDSSNCSDFGEHSEQELDDSSHPICLRLPPEAVAGLAYIADRR